LVAKTERKASSNSLFFRRGVTDVDNNKAERERDRRTEKRKEEKRNQHNVGRTRRRRRRRKRRNTKRIVSSRHGTRPSGDETSGLSLVLPIDIGWVRSGVPLVPKAHTSTDSDPLR